MGKIAAGLHRVLAHERAIESADIVIVVAGMEGALASVVAGMTHAQVIAVPTSTGYGSGLEGVTVLLAMHASCSPGITVVGIDACHHAGSRSHRGRLLGPSGSRECAPPPGGEITEPATASFGPTSPAVVLEANVDDLDPRLWPEVIAALMEAGADDAWLTPIVMKKGRPAHTLSVLAAPHVADTLGRVLLAHSSTIGFRRTGLDKVALPREATQVLVDGQPIRLKIARLDGAIVNVSAEYVDVARVAKAAGRPEKLVLAEAMAAAHALLSSAPA